MWTLQVSSVWQAGKTMSMVPSRSEKESDCTQAMTE